MKQKRGLFAVLVVTFLFLLLFQFAQGESPVLCGTVDGCVLTAPVDCPDEDEILPDQQEARCSPGCCQIFPTDFCEFGLSEVQCKKLAQQYLGSSAPESDSQFSPVDQTSAQSPQQQCFDRCGIRDLAQATLIVIVKDASGTPVPNAKISLPEARISEQEVADDGTATFHLKPGVYTVDVTASDLGDSTFAVSLGPGDTLTKEVILRSLRTGSVSGEITYELNGLSEALEGAVLTFTGPEAKEVSSGSDGTYEVTLTEGTYTLRVSPPPTLSGYGRVELLVSVVADEENTVNVPLKPEQVEGVFGQVKLAEEPVPGASVFVDYHFKASTDREGRYRITIPPDGKSHLVHATYATVYLSQKERFNVAEEQQVKIDLLLEPLESDCSLDELQETLTFSAQDVTGEQEVLLVWTPPECVQDVDGYLLFRSDWPEGETEILQPQPNFFVDREVSWGQSYTYTLQVIYHFDRESPETQLTSGRTDSVTLGDPSCGESVSSCSSSGTVDSCNELNDITSQSCITSDDNGDDLPDQACGPAANGQATCREVAPCAVEGDPFGLFYSKFLCYGNFAPGTKPAKFCVFDATETSVNSCTSCTEIESCFAYKSKDACTINSCRVESCTWIDAAQNKEPLINYGLLEDLLEGDLQNAQFVTPETGAGYCVESNYKKDAEYCGLCDPEKPPFSDFFCTAQVCSNLGRCFSTPALESCSSCGEIPTPQENCYSYVTELECTAGKKIRQVNGVVSPSNDSCGWGTCLWTGSSNSFSQNSCGKDGDMNGKDDCLQDLSLSGAELQRCQVDNTPPTTQLLGTVMPSVSLVSPQVTVLGDETQAPESQQNDLDHIAFCLLPAAAPAATSAPVACTESDFTKVPYPKAKKTAEVNLSLLPLVKEKANGKNFRLVFYSEDHFKNRESVQEKLLFIDNVAPSFTLKESISTQGDLTTLSLWLENQNEPMACDFTLYPRGAENLYRGPVHRNKEESQSTTFENIDLVAVDANVTCTDIVGNFFSLKKPYLFDLEEGITVLEPKGLLSTTTLSFAATTTLQAQCVLRNMKTGEEKNFDWVEEDSKRHRLESLSGFTPGEYAGTHKMVCRAFADGSYFEELLHFTIDITPPKTKITLKEGTREVVPAGRLWKEPFISSAQVTLECLEDGFPCEKIFYCLGDELSCLPFPTPGYVEYSSTAESPLSLTETTRICYYSTDKAGNKIFSAACGTIEIVGYGITLTQPEPYFYQDEIWGISSTPEFAWEFFTKVPTEECRFHFLADFAYQEVPEFQRLQPTGGRYLIFNFPAAIFQEYPTEGGIKTIYVKCKSLGGELSPEQKFNLEYDPLAPTILTSSAEPATLYEGIRTSLFATTDKKTLCKYSDNSEDLGSTDFATMEYTFPGLVERILHRSHQDIFTINNFVSADGKKNYLLNTQCSSGAGILSQLEQISFLVDYSDKGFLVEGTLVPSGYVEGPEVPISMQTSKSATCEYWFGEKPTLFTQTGGTFHTATLSDVVEGSYEIPVQCLLVGGHIVSSTISFTIDHTGPAISLVSDGTLTCGSPFVDVFVQSNEPVAQYLYELFDRGNQTPFAGRFPVYNLSKPFEHPLRIPAAGLLERHNYTVIVHAFDAAGNKGVPKESDGTLVVSQNFTSCINDTEAPRVVARVNETCRSTVVDFTCEDAVGCRNFTYFLATDDSCNSSLAGTLPARANSPQPAPFSVYLGQQLVFNRSKAVCYTVEDMKRNKGHDVKMISFLDLDGDAIADVERCDLCPGTSAGRATNEHGCSSEEVPPEEKVNDTDEDSLPDYWEDIHHAVGCLLNSTNPDSDQDLLGDGREDYDADNATNYEEYIAQSDPCLEADKPSVLGEKEKREEQEGERETEEAETERERREREEREKKEREGEEEIGEEPRPRPGPGDEEESKAIVPLLLLFLGFLLLLGGAGYLLYVYLSPTTKRSAQALFSLEREPEGKEKLTPSPPAGETFRPLAREKTRTRKKFFGAFDQQSDFIPHIEEALRKKIPVHEKLGEVAQKYVEHKEEMKQGLRAEEKSLFTKLENLAEKSKKKSLQEVLEPEKAKDLFSQLQDLSKKRKQK